MKIPCVLLSAFAATQTLAFDVVIGRAQIHGSPGADALAVKDGKIAVIGSSATLRSQCVAPCRYLDAANGFLLPGFHDAHAHPSSAGANGYRLSVGGSSIPSIQSALRAYAKSNPDMPWIVGRGWNAAGFGVNLPRRQDLDAAEAVRPVVLIDSDGHQLWVNSAALRAAGVTAQTPNPEGGTIVRDAAGEPTGLLLENATDLVYEKIPEPSEEMRRNYVSKGEQIALESGFSSVHGGSIGLKTAQSFAALDRDGQLKLRHFLWAPLDANNEDFARWVEFAQSLPANGKVKVGAFKGFVDGVVSAYTAAMLAPYADNPATRGEPAISQEKLNEYVLRANRAGFPVALHAIGDRAVRMSLDAFELSLRTLAHKLINRVEHIETLDPADAPRFAHLNVAASMQPSHMHFGSAGSSYYPPRLGPERLKYAFAWREIAKHGGLMVFGTDAPVVDQDPIEGMHCAVKRTYGNGTPFNPEQKLSGDEALAAFTVNPARAVGMEAQLGRVAVGHMADLLLLRQDPRTGSASSLGGNPPQMVMVAGVVQLENSKGKTRLAAPLQKPLMREERRTHGHEACMHNIKREF